jgi:hypothetical protein
MTPPTDPLRLGAANRALARVGVPWRFGTLEQTPAIVRGHTLDGISTTSRYRLIREGAGTSDTLATAAGDPWIVAGPGYVLSASRLDASVTTLPVRAAFVPWLADVIAVRLGAPPGDMGASINARPESPIRLPPDADALESPVGALRQVSGGHATAPAERGVWFVRQGAKRIGAVVVNAPADESALARLSGEELAGRLASAQHAGAATSADRWIGNSFAAGTRRPAVTPLLVLAVLLLIAEAAMVRTSRSAAA